MHVGLARVLGELGQMDAARTHLHAAQEVGEHAGLPQNAYRWRLEAARLRETDGDVEGALLLLDEAEHVFTTDSSPNARPLAAVRARLHLARGQIDAATAWTRASRLSADDDLRYVREYEHLTLVQLHLAPARQGDSERMRDATDLLERLEVAAADGGRRGSVIQVRALRAMAHQVRGDGRSAIAELARAVAQAQECGHVRVFSDEGEPMLIFLCTLSARPGAAPHTATLVFARPSAAPAAAPPQGLVEPLSAREIEVVQLLASDLDGLDIAGTLVVSVNTVGTHTKNIDTKLGVNSRRAAVRRAQELGLLTTTTAGGRR